MLLMTRKNGCELLRTARDERCDTRQTLGRYFNYLCVGAARYARVSG